MENNQGESYRRIWDRQAALAQAPVISTRNLLYHIYPCYKHDGGERWRWNCKILRSRIEIFNGVRVVAIAFDDDSANPGQVMAELSGLNIHFKMIDNNSGLREVATLLPLLSEVEKSGDATFWGHAKGTTNFSWGVNSMIKRWTEVAYDTLLCWDCVEPILREHPVAGSFKRHGAYWPGRSHSRWHYAGSFFWFRNQDLFSRNWREVDQFNAGAETYPSIQFEDYEAGTVFMDFTQGGEPSWPYRPEVWRDVIEPEYAKWIQPQQKDCGCIKKITSR